jgi:V/A-type H+-transporting ATPase subunit D
MAKIKYTKNELKIQKDELKRFKRYLPTLILKKQQLQMEIRKIQSEWDLKKSELNLLIKQIDQWIAVFAEKLDLDLLIEIESINISQGNIAGVEIPILEGIAFKKITYDLYKFPLWVDTGIITLNRRITLEKELEVLVTQIGKLNEELRITTQRVNLFEKVKIPEAGENIRKINIYLGDQQTAAVVCGKISKNKLLRA